MRVKHMSNKIFCRALCALLLALGFPAQAQQPKKVPQIGILTPVPVSARVNVFEAFRKGLRELGYIEGKNIAIEIRSAEGKQERFPALAAGLVHLKVDIIVVAGGNTLIRAAMNATKTTPIVMAGAGPDPVEAGFVESLARPGGNVTGVSTLSGELGGKRLELFKEAVTKIARVAILYDPAIPATIVQLKDVQTAARALGLTIQAWEIRGTDDFDRVFAAMGKERPDGLYVLRSLLMNVNEKRIVGFALKSRLPSVYSNREAVEAGGLMYYGADFAESYRRVAYYVDRILKGAKPAELPVEQPTKFELIINLKTAKQIGLTIPQSVLFRADKVIR